MQACIHGRASVREDERLELSETEFSRGVALLLF